MKLIINPLIRKKLKEKYGISPKEVKECFLNREKGYLIDTEEKYDYPTLGFISKTNRGKRLRIVFIDIMGAFELKTAHPVDEIEEIIYESQA